MPSRLDNELTIRPDSRFILANPDPLVDPVHTLEISLREAERQEAEYVPTQVTVIACVSRDDHEIGRNDRVGNHAPDGPFQRSEALGIGAGHRRRLGREAADVPDLHAAIVDSTPHVRKYGRDGITRQDPEVDHRSRIAGEHVIFRSRLKDRWCLDRFERAIAIDPSFAPAHAALSGVYGTLGAWEYGVLPPAEALAKAKAAATRALELDPQLAAGHTAVGYTRLHFDWNADGACREFDQAIALNPAWVDAHHWHSHALCAAARFPESLAACRRIVELDPLNPLMHAHVAWHHYMARDFADALTQAERVVRVEPSFHWGHFFAGWALERLGRGAEAIAALREAVRCSSNSPVMLAGLGHALAVLQDRREALRVAEDLERLRGDKGLFAYELGVISAALGDHDHAFRWFTHAVHERSGWIAYLRVDPRLDALHTDSRFDSLVLDATAKSKS